MSEKSETGEDPRKIRESSLDFSQIIKSLNSLDCVAILFNSLKNLDCKMREISLLSKQTTARQIKGEKQLSDLTDSSKLISDKFDEYKKDRKIKDALITNLEM